MLDWSFMYIFKRLLSHAYLALALMLSFSMVTITTAAMPAPPADFSLRSIDGRTVSSANLRGRVVVLAFGASWLPLSRAHVAGVQKVANQFNGRADVFWVSTDSDMEKSKNFASNEQLRAFSDKYNLRVTILRDPDGAFSKTLGVDQLPAIVILDREGNVSGTPIGGINPGGDLAASIAPRVEKLL